MSPTPHHPGVRIVAAAWMTLLCFGPPMLGSAGDRIELDAQIRHLTARLDALQRQPEHCIPERILRGAEGVLLLERTHAGFLFGFQGGAGVAVVKDPHTRRWSAPAFIRANEASLGAQIGVQKSLIVVLFMSRDAAATLSQPSFQLGGEARGTADTITGGVEQIFTAHEQAVLVFDERVGFYGGAILTAGSFSPNPEDNLAYHGQPLSVKDILFEHQAKASEAALDLARVLDGKRATLASTASPLLVRHADSVRNRTQTVFKGAGIAPAKSAREPVRYARRTLPRYPVLQPEPPETSPQAGLKTRPPPVVGTPAEKLQQLVATLKANGQTNELRLLSDYLTSMATTLHATDASTSVAVLEHLRNGQLAEAIELLESHLDSALAGLGSTLEATPENARQAGAIQTLQWTRRYREAHPRASTATNTGASLGRSWQLLEK